MLQVVFYKLANLRNERSFMGRQFQLKQYRKDSHDQKKSLMIPLVSFLPALVQMALGGGNSLILYPPCFSKSNTAWQWSSRTRAHFSQSLDQMISSLTGS